MSKRIIYVELKTGYADNGPAWIGEGIFSKSGQTVYFNGHAFKKAQGISGNHFEIESGNEYWISGVKKNGNDRHSAGSGIIQIDESIIPNYLDLTNQTILPKNKFIKVQLDNVPAKEALMKVLNQKSEQ